MSVRQGNKVIAGGNSITVDQALDINSPNPIANSAVTAGLNGKEPTITGAATTITTNNLTAARAVVTDANGKVAVSTVTSTELGYLHGTTSSVQTQINSKANTADLATVATSGSYNDLSDKPTIPDGDNSTITLNSSNKLQTVATVNANSAAGATNPIYDWVGTMAEYEAQSVATIHPDWVCYITDDIGGSATEIGQITEALNDKVDKGFDIVEFQEPTAANNYTWYKKYRNGWVEQGGFFTKNNTATSQQTVNMPVIMDNNQYQVQTHMADDNESDYVFEVQVKNQTTTGFDVRIIASYQSATWITNYRFAWFVCGKAA